MAVKESLVSKIKQMEEMIEPDTIPFSAERSKVTKIGDVWQVSNLVFNDEQEARAFSKRLKKEGLSAYLAEIVSLLEQP